MRLPVPPFQPYPGKGSCPPPSGACIWAGEYLTPAPGLSVSLPLLCVWLYSLSGGVVRRNAQWEEKDCLQGTLGSLSQVPFSRIPAQEPTDFLSRLRRCLPCPLGRGAVPLKSPRPCSLPLHPCYGSEPGKRFPQITHELARPEALILKA